VRELARVPTLYPVPEDCWRDPEMADVISTPENESDYE
jgi:hypothetical protein